MFNLSFWGFSFCIMEPANNLVSLLSYLTKINLRDELFQYFSRNDFLAIRLVCKESNVFIIPHIIKNYNTKAINSWDTLTFSMEVNESLEFRKSVSTLDSYTQWQMKGHHYNNPYTSSKGNTLLYLTIHSNSVNIYIDDSFILLVNGNTLLVERNIDSFCQRQRDCILINQKGEIVSARVQDKPSYTIALKCDLTTKDYNTNNYLIFIYKGKVVYIESEVCFFFMYI